MLRSEMTISQHGRGYCRVCGIDYALRKDGTVRSHSYFAQLPCKGSRELPRQEDNQ